MKDMNIRAPNFAMLAEVPRWVTLRTIKRQSVAEHTFGVMWIYRWLCAFFDVEVDPAILVEAMDHDLHEAFTGDIPAPAMPGGRVVACADMSDHEVLLHASDQLEAWLFLEVERRLGNNGVGEAARDVSGRMAVFLKVAATRFGVRYFTVVQGDIGEAKGMPVHSVPHYLARAVLERRTNPIPGGVHVEE